MSDVDALIAELKGGDVLSQPWMETALREVPREWFVPRRIWVGDPNDLNGLTMVELDADPVAWQRAVWSDDAVVTQVDDGEPGGDLTPTSSCSMPTVVLQMLADADLRAGQRVLEIGTGTGWNAALLCHLAGSDRVVSVEIDPQIGYRAGGILARHGFRAQVRCTDGEKGYPPGAPYDRILSTAAVGRVPPPWLEQCVRGGLILAPFETAFFRGGSIRLEMRGDGTAMGRFGRPLAFMSVRGQRIDPGAFRQVGDDPEWSEADCRDPRGEFDRLGDDIDAAFAAGLLLPDVRRYRTEYGDGSPVVMLHSRDSWAACFDDEVRQVGPRRLGDELAGALDWWHAQGEPEMTEFGATVSPAGQRVWLRSPDDLLR